jgi:hypothetical protein
MNIASLLDYCDASKDSRPPTPSVASEFLLNDKEHAQNKEAMEEIMGQLSGIFRDLQEDTEITEYNWLRLKACQRKFHYEVLRRFGMTLVDIGEYRPLEKHWASIFIKTELDDYICWNGKQYTFSDIVAYFDKQTWKDFAHSGDRVERFNTAQIALMELVDMVWEEERIDLEELQEEYALEKKNSQPQKPVSPLPIKSLLMVIEKEQVNMDVKPDQAGASEQKRIQLQKAMTHAVQCLTNSNNKTKLALVELVLSRKVDLTDEEKVNFIKYISTGKVSKKCVKLLNFVMEHGKELLASVKVQKRKKKTHRKLVRRNSDEGFPEFYESEEAKRAQAAAATQTPKDAA